MNYSGSYRRLLGNAKSAMMAAIEIYNKPSFSYRDECFVILLLNAWELAFKALLSKNSRSIFYKKKRNEPYRTLSWKDALSRAEMYFPANIPSYPIRKNLELIGTYRDNSVHFYNASRFGVLMYALAQTSVKNLRDLLHDAFGIKLEDEISWQLLPLGIQPPIDPISYIAGATTPGNTQTSAVNQYIAALAQAVEDVEGAGGDTSRLLTVFSVKLESTKKIKKTDLIVGVKQADGTRGPLAIVRVQDPNLSHPLRQKDVLEKVATLHERNFNRYTFQVLVWKFKIKDNPTYCWQAKNGALTCYSHDVVTFIKRLRVEEFEKALHDYSEHRSRSKKKVIKS